jgi:hypothetical protein
VVHVPLADEVVVVETEDAQRPPMTTTSILQPSETVEVERSIGLASMPPAGLADGGVDREVTAKDVREACISAKAQQAYRGSLRAMSKWIVENKKQHSSIYFDTNGQIDLKRFTLAECELFLLDKRKSVSVSTLNGYSSALKDLYRRQEVPLPVTYEKSMATFFSGLKRMQAAKYQSGAPRESGKDPLPYSLFQQLCRATLGRQDGGFAHFFLTTQ